MCLIPVVLSKLVANLTIYSVPRRHIHKRHASMCFWPPLHGYSQQDLTKYRHHNRTNGSFLPLLARSHPYVPLPAQHDEELLLVQNHSVHTSRLCPLHLLHGNCKGQPRASLHWHSPRFHKGVDDLPSHQRGHR